MQYWSSPATLPMLPEASGAPAMPASPFRSAPWPALPSMPPSWACAATSGSAAASTSPASFPVERFILHLLAFRCRTGPGRGRSVRRPHAAVDVPGVDDRPEFDLDRLAHQVGERADAHLFHRAGAV